MKNILLTGILLLLGSMGFTQSVVYEVDIDQLYYSTPGCGDQFGTPDPVWMPRVTTNGSQYDWSKKISDIGSCGWQTSSNNYSFTPSITGSASNNIVFSFNGYEDDAPWADDAACGGWSNVATINKVCDNPPYTWNYFTSSRSCTSDSETGTYQVKWSYYWRYNEAPTIVTQPAANTVVCSGNAVTLTVAAGTDACGRNMGLHYQWQYSLNTSCVGATGWTDIPSSDNATLTISSGTFTGTRVYRCLVTSNNSASFSTNTITSNCAVVTVNPMATPPAIISSLCGGTVLPGTTYTLNTLQPPAVGAVANIDNYAWTTSGGTFSPGASGANLTSVNWTSPAIQGSYTIQVEYQDNCGNVSSASCVVNVAESNCDFTYVSPFGVDNAGCGGPGNPCRTLTGTNGALAKNKTYIRMANGNYTEPGIANLINDLVIEGRYEVTGTTWTKSSNTANSTSLTFSGEESVSGVRHRMGFKSNSKNNWKLIDLDITTTAITTQDASDRGASNYGVWIYNSSNYEISRCRITSGNAGNGLGRTTGTGFDGLSAPNAGATNGAVTGTRGVREGGNGGNGGNGGQPGADATRMGGTTATSGGGGGGGGTGGRQNGGGNNNCSGCDNGGSGGGGGGQAGNPSGGAGATNSGGDGNQPGGKKGGNGTDGGIGPGNDDFNSSPYSSDGKIYANGGAGGGTAGVAGSGGKGGGGRTARCNGSQIPSAEYGTNGVTGNNGANVTTTVAGSLGTYFIPGYGNNGIAGQGGGGGGGGGAGGCDADRDDEDGSAGHGGGGGGGGGGAGAGGLGGGGSFAIWRTNNSGIVLNTTLVVGLAGTGGTGGIGGAGGTGANGASDYDPSPAGDSPIGGNGGKGGSGGKGGNGANGPAGISAQMVTNGVTSSPSSSIPNSPIVNINYNNTRICSNSVVEIEKSIGTWNALPANWEYVKYEDNVTTSQYSNASSPAEITTTNTNGFYDLGTSGAIFHSYLDVLGNRPKPVVTIKANDGSTLTPAATICNGGTVQLTATSWGTEVGYQWDVYAGNKAAQKGSSAPTALFSSTLASPVTGSLPAGTYTVRYQVKEQCCGWSIPVFATITVVADPTPPTDFSLTAGPVCVGTTINASAPTGATNGILPYTYEWDYDNINHAFSGFSTSNPSFPAAEGDNTVIVRVKVDDLKGCDATATIQKVVVGEVASTAPSSLTSNGPFCIGNEVTLTANGGTVGTNASYNWYSGSCSGTFLGTTTTNTFTTTALPGTTNYYVNIGPNTCGTSTCATIAVNNTTPNNTLAHDGDVATCHVNTNNWVHFYNVDGRLIASVNSHGQDLGEVTATCFQQISPISVNTCAVPTNTNPGFFTDVLGRRWTITPENQPTTNVDVRLYYDQNEYDALNPAANTNANPNDNTTTYQDLKLTKFTETDHSGVENGSFADNCGHGTVAIFTKTASNAITTLSGWSAFDANGRFSEYGINSFSEFWLHGDLHDSPLPVELTAFTASCVDEAVLLHWTTASEINSDHFILERSRDGVTWEVVAQIEGAGNKQTSTYYSATDENALYGISYYRLRQVDFDGEEKVYPAISSQCGTLTDQLWVQPNPNDGNFTVVIHSKQKFDGILILNDISGRKITERKVSVKIGKNEFYFQSMRISKGAYILYLSDQNDVFDPVKFIVK